MRGGRGAAGAVVGRGGRVARLGRTAGCVAVGARAGWIVGCAVAWFRCGGGCVGRRSSCRGCHPGLDLGVSVG